MRRTWAGESTLPHRILAIHERLGFWSRQLRPRLADRLLKTVDTRSAADLEVALSGAPFPLVLIDLRRHVGPGLEDLARALTVSPDAMTLVLDPGETPGVTLLARELGATAVLSGPVPPPAVAAILGRWTTLAQRRAEASGWSASDPAPPEPGPWGWINPLIRDWEAALRAVGTTPRHNPPNPPRLPTLTDDL